MRIGLVTDTHLPSTIRHLWDEVKEAFAGVDLILHGGDIVTPRVLDWLEEIAPTLAVEGNNDGGWEDPRMKDIQWLDLEGWRVAMIHDMEPEERPIAKLRDVHLKGEHADIIITGHTHYERLDYRDGVLQINTRQCNPSTFVVNSLRDSRIARPGARQNRGADYEAWRYA